MIYLYFSVDLYILSNHYYRTTAHYYCITLSYRRWNTIAWNSYIYFIIGSIPIYLIHLFKANFEQNFQANYHKTTL